jgi:hypothetical protein
VALGNVWFLWAPSDQTSRPRHADDSKMCHYSQKYNYNKDGSTDTTEVERSSQRGGNHYSGIAVSHVDCDQ